MNDSRPPLRGPQRTPRDNSPEPSEPAPPRRSRLDDVQEKFAFVDKGVGGFFGDRGADRRERQAHAEDIEVLRSARHLPRDERMKLYKQHRRRRLYLHLAILIGAIVIVVVIIVIGAVNRQARITNKAKWSEAIANAGVISSALRVLYTEGSEPQVAGEIDWAWLNFEPGEFHGTYFTASDYRLLAIDFEVGRWTIEVRSSRESAPPGVLVIDQNGASRMDID